LLCIKITLNKKRIILLIDTIHPDYLNKKYYICAGLLASQTMKIFTSKYEKTKKVPKYMVIFIHKVFTLGFLFVLFVQNFLKIDLAKYLMKLR